MTITSKLFPPRSWFAAAAVGWGISSTLMVSSKIIISSNYAHSHHSRQLSIILAWLFADYSWVSSKQASDLLSHSISVRQFQAESIHHNRHLSKHSFTLSKKWVFGWVVIYTNRPSLTCWNVYQMAYWFGFAAVAGAFGGLIAFGVQHIQSHVPDWRILFIVEVHCSLLVLRSN